MDYVKQGVDQLGQAAEKVKEAVSNATSTVVGAVSGDQKTSESRFDRTAAHSFECRASSFLDRDLNDARQHGS